MYSCPALRFWVQTSGLKISQCLSQFTISQTCGQVNYKATTSPGKTKARGLSGMYGWSVSFSADTRSGQLPFYPKDGCLGTWGTIVLLPGYQGNWARQCDQRSAWNPISADPMGPRKKQEAKPELSCSGITQPASDSLGLALELWTPYPKLLLLHNIHMKYYIKSYYPDSTHSKAQLHECASIFQVYWWARLQRQNPRLCSLWAKLQFSLPSDVSELSSGCIKLGLNLLNFLLVLRHSEC